MKNALSCPTLPMGVGTGSRTFIPGLMRELSPISFLGLPSTAPAVAAAALASELGPVAPLGPPQALSATSAQEGRAAGA